uniref:Uncharacterized protein n=1 Tax=Avena sativa TaxID=4498 RepID=A0ACD5X205_AVESA
MNWYSRSQDYPPVVDEGAVADPPGNCLLDSNLFVGDRTNATTAWYDPPEDDEMSIQVTLFVAPPPRVSCILACCDQTYFTEQPKVISTHDELVLLSIAFAKKKNCRSPEYYIYQPFSDPGDDADRFLELIPQPSDCRLVDEHNTVGLLSSHGGYHIAVITMSMKPRGVFDLYVFSSETKIWTVKNPTVSLPMDADVDFDDYMADKAIPLGGGSMAFVDFDKGILICDVLDGSESPELHYLPLPSEELCQPLPDAYPSKPHDLTIIAISSDTTIRFKFAKSISAHTDSGAAIFWTVGGRRREIRNGGRPAPSRAS